MASKSRGGGGGRVINGMRLSRGARVGASVPANRGSFQVGDVVRIPSDSRSSGFTGTVTSVRRTQMTLSAPYMTGENIDIDVPISSAAGGVRARVRFATQ